MSKTISGASVTLTFPDLGTDDAVDVVEIHVTAGDSITQDQALITLETDKASVEVPATEDGIIEALLVKVGDKVRSGQDMA